VASRVGIEVANHDHGWPESRDQPFGLREAHVGIVGREVAIAQAHPASPELQCAELGDAAPVTSRRRAPRQHEGPGVEQAVGAEHREPLGGFAERPVLERPVRRHPPQGSCERTNLSALHLLERNDVGAKGMEPFADVV
jgi:hypothetical protein